MNVAAMRENGEKGVSIQNVEWDSDGYAGLDIGMVLMNNDEAIFAMIIRRPVGWWVLKVEVSLGNQWETQGKSTTLCVFQKVIRIRAGLRSIPVLRLKWPCYPKIFQFLDGGMILMIAEQQDVQMGGQRLPIVGSRGSSLEKRAYISWIKIVQLSTKPLATSLD
ncbi:uncharacterized protein Bfra_004197 [Botrytis fragariae]|uniref:Uncharacterized protein n=1 Tax=Botrytis fragariae TaxID=1964551 RepID=A0A8H6AV73_9HELO|nr:uncharacterized protein Bfra_004197 [Botrytis fragariae]KAF5874191.1 hypothetical protein Bfra_004197 [Botrytis fragariae]